MQERKQSVLKRKSVLIRMAVLVIPMVLLLLLSQTAFAENTYVITDGDRVLVHTTKVTDPKAVLNEAGLALDADDTYTTQAGIGVSEITVRRGQSVTVHNCGQTMQIDSQGETVKDMLTRLSIPLDGNTKVSEPLDAMTYDGMELTVSRTVRVEESYTAAIPHKLSYYYDSSIPEGTTKVLVKGVDGQAACTANVVYVDGKEISRTVLSESVIQQPVEQVVAVGSGTEEVAHDYVPQVPVIGDGIIITPTGEVLTYTGKVKTVATAYSCDYRKAYTYTGTVVKVGSVAVDPKVIPHGTRMFIVSDDGEYIYGVATAEDTGYLIDDHRIDLYMDTTESAIQFGVRTCSVYILGEADIVREDI